MAAHPSHYYIKYLLIIQEDLSNDSINSTLTFHGMAPADQKCLAQIRAEVQEIPEDFAPWDKSHQLTNRWLRSQKIYSFVHPDDGTLEMRDRILGSPRLRRDVEGLLLGNVGVREAAFRLQKLGHPVSEVAIAEYRHYFWNTEVMGLSDWIAYFEVDESEVGTRRTLAGRHFYENSLVAGAPVALYRIGVKRQIERRQILEELQAELYHSFLEVKGLPISPKKVEMLASLTRGLVRVDERLQEGDSALTDVLKKFEKFRVLKDKEQVPSLIELAPTGSISQKSRAEIVATQEN